MYPRALVVLQPIVEDLRGDVTDGSGDREIAKVDIIPLEVAITRDRAERCDTMDVVIRWQDYPLDPRVVADCRVTAFIANADAPDEDLYADNTRFAQFIGFVDNHEVACDDSGGMVVRLMCRDYAGRLIDQRHDGKGIPTSSKLSDIARRLLDAVNGYQRTRILVDGDRTLKSLVRGDLWTPTRGSSIWDVLVAIGREAGMEVTFIDGDLVMRPVRTSDVQRVRSLTLGVSIHAVRFERPASPIYRKAVQLRCINARTGRRVVSQYPATSDEVITYNVPGTYTEADLLRMAKAAFISTVSRRVVGTITTYEMTDDAGEDLAGVESVRAGDKLHLYFATGDRKSVFGKSAQALTGYLEAGGLTRDEAGDIVQTWFDAEELSNRFTVRTARHRWTAESGYQLDITFENLVTL